MGDNAVERRLRELIGHLLASQEEERRRLACALHDDFSQQLALLAIDPDSSACTPPVADRADVEAPGTVGADKRHLEPCLPSVA